TQVTGDSGLAITRARAGDHDHLRTFAIFIWQQNRSQRSSRAFRHHRWLALPGSKLRTIRFPCLHSRRRAQGTPTVGQLTRYGGIVQWNNAQLWQIEINLSVARYADPAVHALTQQHKSKTE